MIKSCVVVGKEKKVEVSHEKSYLVVGGGESGGSMAMWGRGPMADVAE